MDKVDCIERTRLVGICSERIVRVVIMRCTRNDDVGRYCNGNPKLQY